MPKRVKYRKAQRGRMRGKAHRGSSLAFGEYGLKALEPGWITNRQIEAARVALTRSLKRAASCGSDISGQARDEEPPRREWKGQRQSREWVAVISLGGFSTRWKASRKTIAKEAFRTGGPEDRAHHQVRDGGRGLFRSDGRAVENIGKRTGDESGPMADLSDDELGQKFHELSEEIFTSASSFDGRGEEPSRNRPGRRDLAAPKTVQGEARGTKG